MFLSHFSWLCITLPTLIAATPQRTAPARPKRSLPPKLQQQIPACAQPCLQTSLSEQFPFACTTPADLSCLCSRYSFNGRTLGEVAVECIYASCSSVRSATAAYNICLGEKYAVAPTLTALTVVAKTSQTSTSMVSSRPITITTSHTRPTTSSTSQSRSSHTETVIADSVSLVPSATSTTRQETTTPLATTETPKTMTPSQIAGLSVAVGAALIIAIGLIGLTIFLRRRRERKVGASVNEKGDLSPGPSTCSSRYSLPFAPTHFSPDSPKRFLLPPPPARKTSGQSLNHGYEADAVPKPLNLKAARNLDASSKQPSAPPNTDLKSIHPLLRPAQKSPDTDSNPSVPLEQIGLAITVEPPRPSANHSEEKMQLPMNDANQQRPTISRRNANVSQRPDSVMTQTTLFEEDDVRRESKLLPALPSIPVPPIRSFQPSRPLPAISPIQAAMERTTIRQIPQQPELFLEIPIRHSRSQLPKTETTGAVPRDKRFTASATKKQLPSVPRTADYNPRSADSDLSQSGDIPDYYFTAYQEPKAIHSVTTSKASRRLRLRQDQTNNSIKPVRSSSNVSRATSRASTNIRDSISSQTSFETVDPDDPTPEDDESDKRLHDGKLSPVAESPIHKLRYPKVPRTSNQLVPRSPKSPQSQISQGSPRWQSQPSSLLVKRKGEQGALRLGSPFTGSPDARTTSEIRRYRQHLRSSSVETFSPTRNSERSTRTQSSVWPKSPAMFEPDVVRPLTIRKTQLLQTPTEEVQALKSPLWVPRLTPTRQGDDLFINVTYSKPGQASNGNSVYLP